MSISLYCRKCRNYIGHHHPDVPRNYHAPAAHRRDYDNVCPQCEAVEGRYEARHHARQMWNMSMRAHAHVIEACRKTIAAIDPRYRPDLKYSIGRGGYTVLQPARTHKSMLQSFTDQDAFCLLELGGKILTCPEYLIRDYHVSENFAIWCALMRHVECSKMTREAVAGIVNTGVTLVKQGWKTWLTDLAGQHVRFLVQQDPKVTPRLKMMKQLGDYFSSNLTRSEAQGAGGQGMAYTSIPMTPPREEDEF